MAPERISVGCCIAGGGPAGMMLGYLLALKYFIPSVVSSFKIWQKAHFQNQAGSSPCQRAGKNTTSAQTDIKWHPFKRRVQSQQQSITTILFFLFQLAGRVLFKLPPVSMIRCWNRPRQLAERNRVQPPQELLRPALRALLSCSRRVSW